MKWISTAIGAVIAISSIGIIATGVYGITRETIKDEVVTFEVLTETTVTGGTFDLIDTVILVDGSGYSVNLKSIIINNTEYPIAIVTRLDVDVLRIELDYSGEYNFLLYNDDTILSEGYDIQVGSVWVITFEVPAPPQLTGISATLIILAPLIFTGAVIIYFYNNINNKRKGL